MQAHPARARLPFGSRVVAAEARELLPRLPGVGGAKYRGVFHARVDRIGVVQRRLEVPDAFEFPGVRRAVVPLVRAGRAVVGELVADRLPGLAAVVAPLDGLPEPAAGLRGINAVGIGGRAFEMVHFPAAEDRPFDLPVLPPAVGGQNERAFARAHENANAAHSCDPVSKELVRMHYSLGCGGNCQAYLYCAAKLPVRSHHENPSDDGGISW